MEQDERKRLRLQMQEQLEEDWKSFEENRRQLEASMEDTEGDIGWMKEWIDENERLLLEREKQVKEMIEDEEKSDVTSREQTRQ